VRTPDAGEIILDGKPIRIRNPGEAARWAST
jgi:ribose transport system ATP-binding protein